MKYCKALFTGIFLVSLFFHQKLEAQSLDSLLLVLDNELRIKNQYVSNKYVIIDSLKNALVRKNLSGIQDDVYKTYNELFKQYQSFKYDSAYIYVEEAKKLALTLGDSSKIATSKSIEGFVLLSSGLFKEAIDTLNSVDTKWMDGEGVYELNYNKARYFFDLSEYNGDDRFRIDYTKKGIQLLNQAQQFVPSNSENYLAAESLKQMKLQNWKAAEETYLKLISKNLSPHNYAVATSSLSYVYDQMNDASNQMRYLTLAAISDIRSATKENTALKNLAVMLYNEGDLERANKYVHIAMNDATFYNARHRKIELSSILPIIEGTQLCKVEQKNSTLKSIITLLVILAGIILLFLGIIFKQLREKNKVRRALTVNNLQLKETNLHLMEADAIKQDYITYFLKATSTLIHKIETLQNITLQKVKTRKTEEIIGLLRRYSVKKEREGLFRQFDEVFLKLFPTFIDDFNSLLPNEERRSIKKDELLSTELRIFALYRLGIQDPQQVADFLELSVSTVYTYKTRLKNKSLFKEDFDEKVMGIKRL